MPDKQTYEALEHRVRELERESDRLKLAEEELRASEEKYRSILENMEEGYWEVDLAGNFTFFNESRAYLPKEGKLPYVTVIIVNSIKIVGNNVFSIFACLSATWS